ncbi:MAG: hypothetical protein JJE42_14905 [Burkholderiales bacterium]|nr:hypothetical protein [Burkholderiales bacterium]
MRADEKHIRTQSAILWKNYPGPRLLLSTNTVGARSAQWPLFAYSGIEMPHFELK